MIAVYDFSALVYYPVVHDFQEYYPLEKYLADRNPPRTPKKIDPSHGTGAVFGSASRSRSREPKARIEANEEASENETA